MWIIIWGSRHYGRVAAYGGEYLCTRFFHIWFFPIVPLGSRWVTREVDGDQLLGFEVPLSARSVAATYLRFWAPVVALALGATLTWWGLAAAAALVALSGWSWTWWHVRGDRERRRAQLNQLAFGTSCDPSLRSDAQCTLLRGAIDAGFAELGGGRTPDDVARLGAETPQQAALAYASLRLRATTARGRTARQARAASEQVLDRLAGRGGELPADDGPYRAKPAALTSAAELGTAATSVMNERDREFHEALAAARGPAPTAWDNSPDNPAVKAEIARNKAAGRKHWGLDLSWKGWALLLTVGPAFAGFVGYKLYNDERAARAAMVELRAIADELCACETQSCATTVVADWDKEEIDRLERTARDGVITSDGDVNELANRVERCMRELTFAPP